MKYKDTIAGQRNAEIVRVLPELTTLEKWSQPEHKTTNFSAWQELQKLEAYKASFTQDDTLAALASVAHPHAFTMSQHTTDLKVATVKGQHQYPLAHLARGFLLLQENKVKGADAAFQAAINATHQFRPHEHTIFCVASFERLFLQKKYDEALEMLNELQKLTPAYTSFKSIADIQLKKLIDITHMPTIKELAKSGSVDMQYVVLQDACVQSLALKNSADACAIMLEHASYTQSLSSQDTYKTFAQRFELYAQAATSFQNKKYDHASRQLLTLLSLPDADEASLIVRQCAYRLIDAVAATGQIQARCYQVAVLLKSNNKNERARGLSLCESLIQQSLKSDDTVLRKLIETSQIQLFLEELAHKNNVAATQLFVQLACDDAVTCTDVRGNSEHLYQQFLKIKKCYVSAHEPGAERTAFDKIGEYADAVCAYYAGQYDVAAHTFLGIMASKSKTPLHRKMCIQASQFIKELVIQGQLDACVYDVYERIKNKGKKLSREEISEGLVLLEKYFSGVSLNAASAKTVKSIGTQIADAGSGLACFLIGRLSFLEAHLNQVHAQFVWPTSEQLSPAFKYAALAKQAGVQEASPLVHAVMLYRGTLGLLAAKKDDLAFEQLVQLLSLQGLPEREHVLCRTYARENIEKLAKSGHLLASKWEVASFLDDASPETCHQGLATMTHLVQGLNKLDFGTKDIAHLKSSLHEYARFEVFKKIRTLACDETKQASIRAHALLVLSQTVVIESALGISLFEGDVASRHAALESSIMWGEKACTLAIEKELLDACRDNVGQRYCDLGQYYLEQIKAQEQIKEFELKSSECFAKGVQLHHPGCMRAFALIELDRATGGDKISIELFKKHMTMLEEAFKLGDEAAGVVLAQHYFDGDCSAFGCGRWLNQNVQKGSRYALKIGADYPATKRICAYVEYLLLEDAFKKQYIKGGSNCMPSDKVRPMVIRLMESALDGQTMAYTHLESIALSPYVNSDLNSAIINFFDEQGQCSNPAALCALGSMLVSFKSDEQKSFMKEAQESFEKAAELSNGLFGFLELTKFYMIAKPDIEQAAHYCMRMIEVDEKSHGAPKHHVRLIAQLVTTLSNHECQSEEQRAKLVELRTIIMGRLHKIGIQVVNMEELAREDVSSIEPGLLRSMPDAQKAYEGMSALGDGIVQEYAGNAQALKSLQKSARQNNPYAHYVLSKLFDAQAESLREVTVFVVKQYEKLVSSAIHAHKSVVIESINEEYRKQFVYAYKKLFNESIDVIEHCECSAKNVELIFATVMEGLDVCQKQKSIDEVSKQEILTLGETFLDVLSQKGFARAIELRKKTKE